MPCAGIAGRIARHGVTTGCRLRRWTGREPASRRAGVHHWPARCRGQRQDREQSEHPAVWPAASCRGGERRRSARVTGPVRPRRNPASFRPDLRGRRSAAGEKPAPAPERRPCAVPSLPRWPLAPVIGPSPGADGRRASAPTPPCLRPCVAGELLRGAPRLVDQLAHRVFQQCVLPVFPPAVGAMPAIRQPRPALPQPKSLPGFAPSGAKAPNHACKETCGLGKCSERPGRICRIAPDKVSIHFPDTRPKSPARHTQAAAIFRERPGPWPPWRKHRRVKAAGFRWHSTASSNGLLREKRGF